MSCEITPGSEISNKISFGGTLRRSRHLHLLGVHAVLHGRVLLLLLERLWVRALPLLLVLLLSVARLRVAVPCIAGRLLLHQRLLHAVLRVLRVLLLRLAGRW